MSTGARLPPELMTIVHDSILNNNVVLYDTFYLQPYSTMQTSISELQLKYPALAPYLELPEYYDDILFVLGQLPVLTNMTQFGMLTHQNISAIPGNIKDRTVHIKHYVEELGGLAYIRMLRATFPKLEKIDMLMELNHDVCEITTFDELRGLMTGQCNRNVS